MINDLANLNKPLSQAELDRAAGQQGTEFGKGLRSTTLSMRSGLSNTLGAVGDELGYSGYAKDQYQQADALGLRAQNAAPRVTSFRDINGANDFGDWAAGTLGGLLPSVAVGAGAGLMTGGAAIPAMLAGTAAYTPFEVGETIGRQREAGQPVNLRDAALGGIGSAALQSIVPAGLAGSLAGKVARAPGSTLAGASIKGGLIEGAGEGAGEYAKQLGSTQTLDTLDHGAALDAFAGGVLGGGIMGGAGHLAQYAHQNIDRVGEGVQGVKNAATGLLTKAEGVAERVKESPLGGVAEKAQKTYEGYDLGDLGASMRKVWDTAREKATGVAQKIADSEDIIGDAKEYAGLAGDALKKKLVDDDALRVQTAGSYVKDLAQRKLSPEDFEAVNTAAQNLGDKANQATVAGIKMASDAFDRSKSFVSGLLTKARTRADEMQGKSAVKKSEDYSAARDAIMTELIPTLKEIKPEAFRGHPTEVQQHLNELGDTMRYVIQDMASGTPDLATVIQVASMFPGHADTVFDSVRRVMGLAGPEEMANIFRAVNTVADVERSHATVEEVQRKHLRPDLAKAVRASDLRDERDLLVKWADQPISMSGGVGQHMPDSTGKAQSAKQGQLDEEANRFNDRQVRTALEYRYGKDGADAVIAAVQAGRTGFAASLAKQSTGRRAGENQLERGRVKTDDDGNPIEDAPPYQQHTLDDEVDMTAPTMQYYGAGKGDTMYLHPKHDDNPSKFGPAAQQRMDNLTGKNPGTTLRYLSPSELGPDHPFVKKQRGLLEKAAMALLDTDDTNDPQVQAYVDGEIDKYVVIGHERSTSPQKISYDELGAMGLDSGYGYSEARLDTVGKGKSGNAILDAVKITKAMERRFEKEQMPADSAGYVSRKLRMFLEGVAAVQDLTGRAFDVPDSTVIATVNDKPLTLGRARAIDRQARLTDADKLTDAESAERDRLSAEYRTALPDRFNKGDRKVAREAHYEGRKLAADRAERRAFEHTTDDIRSESEDESGFDGIIERGINRRDTHSAKGKDGWVDGEVVNTPDRLGGTEQSTTQTPRQQRINELRGDLSMLEAKLEAKTATDADRVRVKAISNEIDVLEKAAPSSLGSGRHEIDPFGPTHDALRGEGEARVTKSAGLRTEISREGSEAGAIHINSDGSARETVRTPVAMGKPQIMAEKLRASTSAGARAVGAKLEALLDMMSAADAKGITGSREFPRGVDIPDNSNRTKLVVGGKVADPQSLRTDRAPGELTTRKATSVMNRADREALWAVGDMTKASDVATVVNRLAEKYLNGETKSKSAPPPPEEYTLKEKPRSTPDPKAVAAKKAALSEKARSGDAGLIRDLSTSTDAKGLQRAVQHLNSGKVDANTAAAIEAANTRLGELVRGDPNVAYGLGIKKYSLISSDEEGAHEQRLITRLAEDRRVWLAHDPSVSMDGGKFGKDSFGPLGREFTYFFEYDGRRTHTAVVPDQFVDTLRRYLSRETDFVKRTNLIGYFAAQHVVYDTKTNDATSFGPRATDPSGKLLSSMGALGDTGRQLYDGSPITRVEGVSTFQTARMLATALAWSKHALDKDQLDIKWERISGANIGKVGEGKFSRQDAQQLTPNTTGPVNRAEVDAFFKRVAPHVKIAWANILHAGEFERTGGGNVPIEDIVRLSVHSLNPLSPAYHEALHAFFAKLTDLKHGQIMDVLERAASSAPVMNQLKRLLKDSPEALKQLNNPEERAAYMYQFWAAGQLTVGEQTKNVFQRIADFLRSVLGIWSNDERALRVMEYFHKGDFAKDLTARMPRDVVAKRVLEPGRNAAIEQARKMTEPLLNLGEALLSAGGERLRDTGVPALRELADAIKLHGTNEGEDPGYMPAARTEHAQRMNKLARDLRGTSEAALHAALESLQSKSNDPVKALTDPGDRAAAHVAKRVIRKHLDDAFDYMRDAKVKVTDLGYGKDYFPRVYDAAFISSHQQEFLAVLRKHNVTGETDVMNKLMTNNGAEFNVEVDKPGMQHLKPRKLAHIPDDELAPFMRKDTLSILSTYTMQAARRAEWSRRFGDDGLRITQLMIQAKREGATDAQLETAQKYIRAVDGTLGDTINPEARRLMGNMMVYQNIRLLPFAVFSSVVDPMGVSVRGGSLGDSFNTFKRGLKELGKNFKKNATDDDMTQLAADIGTIDDTALMHTMSTLYLQGMAGNTAQKINDTFFRWNMLEQWNTSMRVGATEAALSFLKKHADGKTTKHSQRWLNELGLQPGELQLRPDGRIKITEADGLTAEQSAKVKTAINRWVDGAVLRPDAADMAIWMNDPHFALIAHMKKFVFSFHQTILKRVVHEYQNGNHAPAMALAGYVPIMIAADLAKGLIQGMGDQPDWKDKWGVEDYLWSGIERAGILGVNQFAFDALGGGIGELAGPTLEQFAQAAAVLGGRGEFAPLLVKSMPANALYAEAFKSEPAESAHID